MKCLFGGLLACLALAGCTETITNTITETLVDTVVVTDTVRPVPFVATLTLVAEGLGSISGQLVDATMYQGVPVFAEQRGPVEDIAGNEILRVPVPATDFGGMLGILGVGERLYISHNDSAGRLLGGGTDTGGSLKHASLHPFRFRRSHGVTRLAARLDSVLATPTRKRGVHGT